MSLGATIPTYSEWILAWCIILGEYNYVVAFEGDNPIRNTVYLKKGEIHVLLNGAYVCVCDFLHIKYTEAARRIDVYSFQVCQTAEVQ